MLCNLFSTLSASQAALDTTLPNSTRTSESSSLIEPLQSVLAMTGSSALASSSDANRFVTASSSTIADWSAADDFIVTGGNRSAYALSFVNVSGGAVLDTVIFFVNDAIAVIEDTTNVNLDRDFIFS